MSNLDKYFYLSGTYEMVIYQKDRKDYHIKLYKQTPLRKVIMFIMQNGLVKWKLAKSLNRMCICYRFPFEIERESLKTILIHRLSKG